MKTFTLEIGGKERTLRFTSHDGVALYRRFNKPLAPLLLQDISGLDEKGKSTNNVNYDAQIALLARVLRVEEERLTGADGSQGGGWIDEWLAADKTMSDLITPAVKAAFYSGVVAGHKVDFDAEVEEGKAPAAPEAVKAAE